LIVDQLESGGCGLECGA